MDIKKIEELVKVFQSSRTEELSVRLGDCTVRIRKGKKAASAAASPAKPSRSSTPRTEAQEPPAPAAPTISAPMVGIFHTVDGIASVGAKVTMGQVVGTIESMKLLNDVVSDVSGTVIEVMVEDGTPVEYGQPLCRVEPRESEAPK